MLLVTTTGAAVGVPLTVPAAGVLLATPGTAVGVLEAAVGAAFDAAVVVCSATGVITTADAGTAVGGTTTGGVAAGGFANSALPDPAAPELPSPFPPDGRRLNCFAWLKM